MVEGGWFVRPASIDDLDAILDLAGQTGPGFSNLPADRDALRHRLEWSDRSFAATLSAPENELYVFVLQQAGSGRIGGTALIFSRIGARVPFYSYKITRLSQYSRQLDRTVTTEVLNLVNDFVGATEVGGLFLLPDLRNAGLGVLLARSRYLFITLHRERFGELVLTELRGHQEPEGVSPFWEGLVRRFFDLEFEEADRFYALNGNQFIADLMPKYPIYTILLPPEARAAIGRPHRNGVAAMKLLEAEGFRYDHYVDLFDAGPTMHGAIDDLRTVRDARAATVELVSVAEAAEPMLLAGGTLRTFRAMPGRARFKREDATLRLVEDGLPPGLVMNGERVFFVTR